MATTELRIELPATEEAKLLLVVKLFEVVKASLGQAAKLAELSKRTFTELLGPVQILEGRSFQPLFRHGIGLEAPHHE